MDILKYFIGPQKSGYHEALRIVPWMLMGFLFQGIFYTQSLWYKLTDQTRYGAIFSVIGGIITLAINVLFIPKIGYMASAIGFFTSSVIISLISWYYGQKYFPVHYDLRKIGSYFLVAISLFVIGTNILFDNLLVNYGFRTLLFSIFFLFIWYMEKSDIKRLLPKLSNVD
jgi:O-antigen/teichoic acid export membrane protein